jgi:hypothetical protein
MINTDKMRKELLIIQNFERQRERFRQASLEHAAIACAVSYTTVMHVAKDLLDSKRWTIDEFKL